LIFEKFRSQLSFEAGHHFVKTLKTANTTEKALSEDKCKHLTALVAETKRELSAEVEKLKNLLRCKERECLDALAQKELADEHSKTLEEQSKQAECELKTWADAEKRKLQAQLAEARLAEEQARQEQLR